MREWSFRRGVWRRRAIGLALAAAALGGLALPGPAAAQEGATLSIDQVAVSDDGTELVALVSVLDGAGRPIPGIEDFVADVDDVVVPVAAVEAVVNQETGVAVLLVMDTSGSMAGQPLEQSRAAARAFVERLHAVDVAGLITFGRSVREETAFEAPREALLGAIDALAAEEETGTALYDAIVRGLETAREAPADRRAMVLLTDGLDSGAASEHSRAEAIALARRAGIPVFTIALGSSIDGAFLDELADAAGGRLYEAPTPDDIPAVFDAVGELLRGQYALTLPLTPSPDEERSLRIGAGVGGATVADRVDFSAPAVAAGEEQPSGGSTLVVVAGVVAVLAVLVAIAAFGWRRRRRRGLPGGPAGETSLPRLREAPALSNEQSGILTVVAGPNAGMAIRMGVQPVDLGSDPSCQIRLEDAGGVIARRHARAWIHSGRLILHHLARGKRTLVDSRPIEWAALEPGDTLEIGPYVIAYASAAPGEGGA